MPSVDGYHIRDMMSTLAIENITQIHKLVFYMDVAGI